MQLGILFPSCTNYNNDLDKCFKLRKTNSNITVSLILENGLYNFTNMNNYITNPPKNFNDMASLFKYESLIFIIDIFGNMAIFNSYHNTWIRVQTYTN